MATFLLDPPLYAGHLPANLTIQCAEALVDLAGPYSVRIMEDGT
jgi:hypothetical protein